MRFGDQRGVVVVRGSVFDGEQVGKVLLTLEDVCIGEVPERHLVLRCHFPVDFGGDLGKGEIVRYLIENGASRG